MKHKKNIDNHSFLKTIRDWNQLPANITSADTIEGFRAALKSSTGRK